MKFNLDELMTAKEAMEYLNISRRALYNTYVPKPVIRGYYKRSEIEAYAAYLKKKKENPLTEPVTFACTKAQRQYIKENGGADLIRHLIDNAMKGE